MKQDKLKDLYRAYDEDPRFDHMRKVVNGSRVTLVPGRGSMKPRVVFVGEAPGKTEDKQRKPFVGAAGQVLQILLSSIGLTREEVFITNVVKYRPTVGEISIRNRKPWPCEIEASYEYLMAELNVFNCRTPICTLGGTALQALFGPAFTISDHHGEVMDLDGRSVIALYHPAVGVYEPAKMNMLLCDFRKLKGFI